MKIPFLDKIFFIDRNIRSGYTIAFVLLLVCYLLIFWGNKKLKEQSELVVHTNIVITQLEVLLSDLKDAETGFRGYLVIKDKQFLQPYNEGTAKIAGGIGKLRSLTIDNPEQQKRLDTLNRLIVKKLEIMKTGLRLFQNSNYAINDSIKTLAYDGKRVMDDTRQCKERMKTYEEKLLETRTDEVNSYTSAIKVINITSLLLAFILIAYSIMTYNRENRLKRQSDKMALLYREELEKSVRDLKEANSELIELRRNEKFAVTGRIARTIAHEVKNPLTNINLATDQLKELMPANDEADMLFDMITRNGNRINQLVSDLLNSTKVAVLNVDKVSINQLLDEALERAKDRIELNHVEVEKKYTPGVCDVAVDKEQIKIAFLNLIVNAVEATENGKGIIYLKTENRFNKCVITIADNGKGMNEDDLLRLFEPFFTNKPKGTGLGLTHTQSIILMHRGLIHVESKPGLGTKFEIILGIV